MSTLKATNIKNVSSGTNNLVLGENGGVVISGLATVSNANVTGGSITGVSTVSSTAFSVNGNAYPSAGPLSNRNLIINGAMQVAQRGTQVTGVTTSGYRTVDRFKINFTSLGTWTIDQATDAPAGFTKSFKATCTTADASPAASDSALMVYQPEAQDLQLLDFGASGAKSITLSFWVKSNKTGAATIAVLQSDNSNKLVSFEYSISSADTWEQKTITIPGDTAGVINDDNGAGFQFEWWLNSGPNYTAGSHRATWTTFAQGNRNPSNLGVGGATSDYFAITGVQLEVGSVATPFEHRSYGDELLRCQRYYQKIPVRTYSWCGYCFTTTDARTAIPLITTMRATGQTITTTNTPQFCTTGGAGTGSIVLSSTSLDAITVQSDGAAGLGGAGTTSAMRAAASTAYIGVESEL